MKIIRSALLLSIVIMAGVIISSYIGKPLPSLISIIVFIVGITFLFLLTLAPGLMSEFNGGIILILLGMVAVLYGVGYLSGYHALPSEDEKPCRIICRVILYAMNTHGVSVGRFVGFITTSGMGLLVCVIGYKRFARAKSI